VEPRVCLQGILAGDRRTLHNKEKEEGRKGRVRRGLETRIGSAQSIRAWPTASCRPPCLHTGEDAGKSGGGKTLFDTPKDCVAVKTIDSSPGLARDARWTRECAISRGDEVYEGGGELRQWRGSQSCWHAWVMLRSQH